jgi:polyhydroxyalkanoate synthesis regulator phasin
MLKESKNQWSEMEEKLAKQALQIAYERETSALIANIRDRASSITELEDLWYLHDLLSTKRYEIDGKYAYNCSTIVFDFAKLVKEGWLHLDELKGFKPEMLSKISALARM